jgi:uncharacterized protein YkwD
MGRQQQARQIAVTIHRFVNDEREERGYSELRGNTDLAAIAEQYARKMAQRDRVSHHLGSTPQERAPRFRGVSENCLKALNANRPAKAVANEAVSRWMHSHEHRQNILRQKSAHSGVGVWIKRSDIYTVHMFAYKRGLMQAAVEVSRSIA